MVNLRKISIRKEILGRLNNQSREDRAKKSDIIKNKLLSSPEYNKARVVMFYVSMDEEVDTHRMIEEALKAGKRVAVPYIEKETDDLIAAELEGLGNLEKGPYGILQPEKKHLKEVPLEKIDLVIVPGVGFDEKNNRLGRGKAYYDKFLGKLSPRTVTIAVCFGFQLVKNLPIDTHDLPVGKVITD